MAAKATRKDWIKFLVVMVVFIIGTIVMMLHDIQNLWIWAGYIIVWSWVEVKAARNIHVSWWGWTLIILGLTGLDLLIIHLVH